MPEPNASRYLSRAADLLALVWFSGLGRRRIRRLIDLYSSAAAALAQLPPGLAGELRSRAGAEMERLATTGIELITFDSPDFPPQLAQIPDAPLLLCYRGRLEWLRCQSVSVVGSRQASEYGRRAAVGIARDLAEAGVTVVSGLARGIDTAAHRGALESTGSGSTVAVLGTGLDLIYPRENRKLAEEIAERGVLVSEYPLGSPPEKYHFPERNRIISGLSRGVVVVEASQDSGSLITVDFALEQGREVFAVPGSLFSPLSQGPHGLIRQGARLCAGAPDILEELGLRPSGRSEPAPAGRRNEAAVDGTDRLDPSGDALDHEEERLLGFVDRTVGLTVDRLAELAQITAASAVAGLLTLEIKGLVRQLPGGLYIRI